MKGEDKPCVRASSLLVAPLGLVFLASVVGRWWEGASLVAPIGRRGGGGGDGRRRSLLQVEMISRKYGFINFLIFSKTLGANN